MLTTNFKHRSRLVAGIALGLTMGLSGFATAQAATTGGTTTDQGQHYENCFGELLSPNHAQDCGTLPTSNSPTPGGVAQPVHDGGATACLSGSIQPAILQSIEVASLDPSWEYLPELRNHSTLLAQLPHCPR